MVSKHRCECGLQALVNILCLGGFLYAAINSLILVRPMIRQLSHFLCHERPKSLSVSASVKEVRVIAKICHKRKFTSWSHVSIWRFEKLQSRSLLCCIWQIAERLSCLLCHALAELLNLVQQRSEQKLKDVSSYWQIMIALAIELIRDSANSKQQFSWESGAVLFRLLQCLVECRHVLPENYRYELNNYILHEGELTNSQFIHSCQSFSFDLPSQWGTARSM